MTESSAGFGSPGADPDRIPDEPAPPTGVPTSPATGPSQGQAGRDALTAGTAGHSVGDSGDSGTAAETDPGTGGTSSAGGAAGTGSSADRAGGEAGEEFAPAPAEQSPESGPAGGADHGGGRGTAQDPSPASMRKPRSPAADEAAFLDLVARFDQDPVPGERRWPAAEDIDGPRRPSVIIIRPGGRQPDGMPPDGRHLVDDDPAERTMPPASAGGAGPNGLAPAGGAGAVAAGSDSAGGHPADGSDGDESARDRADRAGRGSGQSEIDRLDDAVRAAFWSGAGSGASSPTADASEDDEDDHYVPPPAPPVPRMRPVTRWALGSIALGVAILVVPSLIGLSQARSRDVAGVLLLLGGVGTLVVRMGDRLPTDFDGPDDGAVV
ncbi:hypothetical protein [Parafrankia sp. FMc2]|uniref:hypothetical protein n=1 Tax=Parafrankia sp. FMc2 TaxID=3233196 RepID=UPI0034D4B75C